MSRSMPSEPKEAKPDLTDYELGYSRGYFDATHEEAKPVESWKEVLQPVLDTLNPYDMLRDEATALSDHQDKPNFNHKPPWCNCYACLELYKRGDSNVNGSVSDGASSPLVRSEQQPQPESKDQGQ